MSLTGLGEAATAIGSIADAAKGIVGHFFADKTEAQKATIATEMQDMMNQYNLVAGQIEINKIEAASNKWWIAGWRPYIGWVCGTGLLYQFLFMPIMNGLIKAILILFGRTGVTVLFVSLDVSTLMTALSGILGIGVLRTFEKYTGTESKR